jgi:hypothetical protein
MPDHPLPQDRPPLDDAQHRDLAEKVGYGSATYWPDTWRHGDEPYRHYWLVLYPEYADPQSKSGSSSRGRLSCRDSPALALSPSPRGNARGDQVPVRQRGAEGKNV